MNLFVANNKQKKTPAFIPFGSTDIRFGENPEAELPGPGAYEIKNEVIWILGFS